MEEKMDWNRKNKIVAIYRWYVENLKEYKQIKILQNLRSLTRLQDARKIYKNHLFLYTSNEYMVIKIYMVPFIILLPSCLPPSFIFPSFSFFLPPVFHLFSLIKEILRYKSNKIYTGLYAENYKTPVNEIKRWKMEMHM